MLEQKRCPVQGCHRHSTSIPTLSSTPIQNVNNMHHSQYLYHTGSNCTQAVYLLAMRPMYAPPLPTPFRFLDLPTEIRLMIYGFCLCAIGMLRGDSELATILHDHTRAVQEPIALFGGTTLLRTCRLVCNEALASFYAKNHFHFTTYGHVNQ